MVHDVIKLDSDVGDGESAIDEADANGLYHVTQPVKDAYPEEVTLTFSGAEYTFSGFVGVVNASRIYPEVLAYEHCTVSEVSV